MKRGVGASAIGLGLVFVGAADGAGASVHYFPAATVAAAFEKGAVYMTARTGLYRIRLLVPGIR